MKSVIESKTMWVNVISLVVAVLQLSEVVTIVPPEWNGALAAVLAAANMILRFLTTQPVIMATPDTARTLTLTGDTQRGEPWKPGGKGLLILVCAVTLAGCSAKQQQVAVQADAVTLAALSGVQDTIDTLCEQKTIEVVPLFTAVAQMVDSVIELVPEAHRPSLLSRLQAIINGVFKEVGQ
jgi:hypothetical protein